MNNIHPLDVFRTAKQYGPNVYAALLKSILAEQKAGRSGYVALHETYERMRRMRMAVPPKEPA